jgi:hypothetical protein
MPGAHAGTLAWHDLSEGRQIPTQRIRVFVVDRLDVLLAEETLPFCGFGLRSHNRGSRASVVADPMRHRINTERGG